MFKNYIKSNFCQLKMVCLMHHMNPDFAHFLGPSSDRSFLRNLLRHSLLLSQRWAKKMYEVEINECTLLFGLKFFSITGRIDYMRGYRSPRRQRPLSSGQLGVACILLLIIAAFFLLVVSSRYPWN